MRIKTLQLALIILTIFCSEVNAQTSHSIAKEWNELLLESIRNDQARPTVHARNLYHTSLAMYDAWAVYDAKSSPVFLGRTTNNFTSNFDGVQIPNDIAAAQEEAISFAMYRLLKHRFQNSLAIFFMSAQYDALMNSKGYDITNTGINYASGNPAELGNYIANQLIQFGLQDGANEVNDYANQFYQPTNDPIVIDLLGNPNLSDFNKWQPITLDVFIDQSGNVLPFNTPPFLSPEWGIVDPFALSATDANIYNQNGFDYWVYHDPGPPPMLDTTVNLASSINQEYSWNFTLVAKWSGHLDSSDTTMWDISPAGIGNLTAYPTNFAEYQNFYDFENGGDNSPGRTLNPVTGMPYAPNVVKRADYARVLAEFWADGPDSETPPGHWFTILNYVNEHPQIQKKFEGNGATLDNLEWDVKSYLSLGGAMHDAAITAWGCKGYYDYIRPVSAIRAMAEKGQSHNPVLPNYHPAGLPLIPGFIEFIVPSDDINLRGVNNEFLYFMKMKTWIGPPNIFDPETDEAGVGWIRGAFWWPYQRPTFVTPNFAGYVSGHSTYSRAAAELLTAFTGDEYFPGGMAEFVANQNEFLVFEEGPSDTITLQWATYRDASDQCSLSRIWGGIHPPADDIPGRLMGLEVGVDAFNFAKEYIVGNICTDYRLVSDSINDNLINANISILANGVQGNNTVNMNAGSFIELQNGFSSNAAYTFEAAIEVCQ